MTNEIAKLMTIADEAKILYMQQQITRIEAKKLITPYIEAVNTKAREIAKKYNQKPRTLSFGAYIR